MRSAYFLLPHPSRRSLIPATSTGTYDDDVSNDDRRTTQGAHTRSTRCRVEVRALPFLSFDLWFPITYAGHPPSPLPANDDRYEMRRECQEILPGLILGPLQAAKSLDILRSLGITHVSVPAFPPQFAIGVTNSVQHARSLFPQGVHSRRERGILGQTAVSGDL